MKDSVDLEKHVGQDTLVTYRDGKREEGNVSYSDNNHYPYRVSTPRGSYTYTQCGQAISYSDSSEDIVSTEPLVSEKEMKNNLNLGQYAGHRVRITYRDGTQAKGRFDYSNEITNDHWPFWFSVEGGDKSWETYTDSGCVHVDGNNAKDIMSIETLDSLEKVEKGSPVEKMALALLPAVFTSLENDPNLKHAIEAAIRGTFLAMFGDDLQGETLDYSVSVIKSRIAISVKQ